MHALVDVDVTKARKILASLDPPASVTAFVIASVARAAAAHPEVHAYRNWRGQLVMHQHVDVSTLVEVPRAQGLFPVNHVLYDADTRDVPDLTAELHRVKRQPAATSGTEKLFQRVAPAATHVPGALRGMFAVMARSVAVRQRIGTVSVSAVGMFGGGGGFGITPLTLFSLGVLVGGMAQRPKVVNGQVEVHDVLDLTLTIDHNVVDGAPAARFAAGLRDLIERAAVLSPPD